MKTLRVVINSRMACLKAVDQVKSWFMTNKRMARYTTQNESEGASVSVKIESAGCCVITSCVFTPHLEYLHLINKLQLIHLSRTTLGL